MKFIIENCRDGILQTLVRDVELKDKEIIDLIIKNGVNANKIADELLIDRENIEISKMGNDNVKAIEHSFYNRIVKCDVYAGLFAYGEWKDDNSYYTGGYILVFSEKDGNNYYYKVMHQHYYEDELDKYGSFTLIDGYTNYFRTEIKQKMRKKPMLMTEFVDGIPKIIENIDNISKIKDIKELLININ